MSNRQKTDFKKGEVAAMSQVIQRVTNPQMSKSDTETFLRSVGALVWSSPDTVESHKQAELRREQWRFGLQWVVYALAPIVVIGTWAWLVPDPSFIGVALSYGLGFTFFAWLRYGEQVAWRPSEYMLLSSGKYFRGGKSVSLPGEILQIARRIGDLFPLREQPRFKVYYIGADPILECHVYGHCIVVAVWDELPGGTIKLLKEPVH